MNFSLSHGHFIQSKLGSGPELASLSPDRYAQSIVHLFTKVIRNYRNENQLRGRYEYITAAWFEISVQDCDYIIDYETVVVVHLLFQLHRWVFSQIHCSFHSLVNSAKKRKYRCIIKELGMPFLQSVNFNS